SVSSSIFKITLPDGKYKIIAAARGGMKKGIKLFELEKGIKQSLKVKTKEISEIVKIFPEYKNRVKEYSFDVEIADKSLDLEIASGTIFGLRVIPEDKNEKELKFDFGMEESSVKNGYKRVSAPKFASISIKGIGGDCTPRIRVIEDKEHLFSVYLKSDTPNFPVYMSVLGYPTLWRTGKKHVVKVGTEWKQYTLSFVPKSDTVYFAVGTCGKPGTLWIDEMELKMSEEPTK
ncbi:hypothetical protein KAW08_03090, partial [bacterium]|nr:hypothetical protein [bacterium]